MLHSFPGPSPAVAVCVAVSSSDCFKAVESQYRQVWGILHQNNFKLFAHLAGCEIHCSWKKKSWHHYGYVIENICSLQSSGQKRKEISSPTQMISRFPQALRRIVFVGPSFLLSMCVWTQLAENWHEIAAWSQSLSLYTFVSVAEVTTWVAWQKSESLHAGKDDDENPEWLKNKQKPMPHL